MWPVLDLKFHLEVLILEAAGDGKWIWLFLYRFPVQFWSSWVGLKAMIHSFQHHLLVYKCGQYSSCNSISEFWSMVQEEMGNQFHYFHIHLFGVLKWVWKLWFIAFRTTFQCVNVASICLAIPFRSFDPWYSRWIWLFLYPFPVQFGVLGWVWKLWFIAFRMTFKCVNRASQSRPFGQCLSLIWLSFGSWVETREICSHCVTWG